MWLPTAKTKTPAAFSSRLQHSPRRRKPPRQETPSGSEAAITPSPGRPSKSASSSTDYDQAIISELNPTLTPREIDIVKLVLEGHPTATIAQRLKLQRGTVKNHRLRIYEKLDITSERELFLTYIQALQRHRANG